MVDFDKEYFAYNDLSTAIASNNNNKIRANLMHQLLPKNTSKKKGGKLQNGHNT
jgi:hypothetical protein